MGDERAFAIEALPSLTKDKEAQVRIAALEAISNIGDKSLFPAALDAFYDKHEQIRQLAVCVSAELNPEAARPRLRALLDDPRPEMRYQAVCQLGTQPDALSALQRSLKDEDDDVRAAAIEALGVSASARVLREALEDKFWPARFNAAIALAEREDDVGIDVLIKALGYQTLSILAARALGYLKTPKAKDALDQRAQSFWLPPVLRAELGGAIGRNEPEKGANILGKMIRGWRIEGKNRAIELAAELKLKTLSRDIKLAASKRGVDSTAAEQALAVLSS